jgi:hypothetical protein
VSSIVGKASRPAGLDLKAERNIPAIPHIPLTPTHQDGHEWVENAEMIGSSDRAHADN